MARIALLMLVPAALLLFAALAVTYLGARVPQESAEVESLEEALLVKLRNSEMDAAAVSGVLAAQFRANKADRAYLNAVRRTYRALATLLGGIAVWLVVGGYVLHKKSNQALGA